MAYIHKETHDIHQTVNERFDENDFIEVDDIIALPVSKLNQKGYKTVKCYAGNPFPTVYCFDHPGNLEKCFHSETEKPEGKESVSESLEYATICIRTLKSRVSYIAFENNLPEGIALPEGWEYDWEENLLYTSYSMQIDPYIFFEQQLQKMKALNEWVEKL